MAASQDALALILRYKDLEAEFYRRGADAASVGALTFTTVQRAVVQQILAQEQAQAAELRRVLGAGAPPAPPPDTGYDFTAGGESGGAPFAGALGAEGGTPYTGATQLDFFKLAQLLEDFGVRLIKGQLGALMSDAAALQAAVAIHATEARHAAEIRIMRSGAGHLPIDASSTAYASLISPWVQALYSGKIADPTFGGSEDDPTSQAYVATLVYGVAPTGPDRAVTPSTSEANQVQMGFGQFSSEAFDEPVDTQTAIALLARFGVVVS
jgi:hypothetical protein